MNQNEFEKQASEGESTYSTPPSKSRVKLTKNSKSIHWEVNVVEGTSKEEMDEIRQIAIDQHNILNKEFPQEIKEKAIKPIPEKPSKEIKEVKPMETIADKITSNEQIQNKQGGIF